MSDGTKVREGRARGKKLATALGIDWNNPADRLKYQRAYHATKKAQLRLNSRAYLWKKLYNLTKEQYFTMLEIQDGRCAICLKEPAPDKVLSVDHDHSNGKVRGLLCQNCNHGLAFVEGHIEKALRYLGWPLKVEV